MSSPDTIEETPAPATDAAAFPWDAPPKPLLTSDATRRLFAAMPYDTGQLIVREAQLFRAGRLILRAMQGAKARHALMNASRPPFFALRSSQTRETFNANLAATSQNLSLFMRSLQHNADAMKRLRKGAELEIDGWLRDNDATYAAGLQAELLVADWHRGLARLNSGLDELDRAIGSACRALESSQMDSSGYRNVSEGSRRTILQASDVGVLLASDLKATNALADERDRLLRGTLFESAFPRLPAFEWATLLTGSIGLPAAFLKQQFGLLIERCKETRSEGLPAVVRQVQKVEVHHSAIKEGYLLGVWQALREFGVADSVEELDLTCIGQSNEQMFEQGVFA